MLARYLGWLLRGHCIQATDRTAEGLVGLANLGALEPMAMPTDTFCPSCEERFAALERAEDGSYCLICAECGWQPVPLEQLYVWRACPQWLPRTISAVLNVQAIGAREVVDGSLWYLGRVSVGPQHMPLWWAVPRDEEHAPFEETIRALTPNGACVLSASMWAKTTAAGVRVIPLADVAAFSPSGLEIDSELLAAHLRPVSAEQSNVIEIAPDGAWLRVNGRELRLRGKQRDFALVMVEAYRQDNLRPRREWVLRRAGYGEAIDDLRQIATRPEFFEFFGTGHGEVWLQTGSERQSAERK